MKLIIQNDRIAATATDEYAGPEQWLAEPEDFDILRLADYRVVDGVVAIPSLTSAEALLKIDSDTDAIYGAVLGNRAQEYTLAESDAAAYKTTAYTGTVPASVQCWATAKGWTAKQAADDILATALAWRNAQAAIRAQRLTSKEAVRVATNTAGVTTALTSWAGFVAVILGQLGI